jgi:hypothetical protein
LKVNGVSFMANGLSIETLEDAGFEGHYPHVEIPIETGMAIEAFLGSAAPVGR